MPSRYRFAPEPRYRYTRNEERADINVFDSDEGSNSDLDIALARPWSMEALSRSAEEDGLAAFKREEWKQVKYNTLLLTGKSLNFVPLVYKHFGRWGQAAENYLNVLARDSEGRPNPAKFRAFWRKQLSEV